LKDSPQVGRTALEHRISPNQTGGQRHAGVRRPTEAFEPYQGSVGGSI